jgi:hypothetical protein
MHVWQKKALLLVHRSVHIFTLASPVHANRHATDASEGLTQFHFSHEEVEALGDEAAR